MAEQECLPMPHEGHDTDVQVSAKKARDPVCGMMVDPATAAHHAEHEGKT
jgi:Cu+-exporting ATPase